MLKETWSGYERTISLVHGFPQIQTFALTTTSSVKTSWHFKEYRILFSLKFGNYIIIIILVFLLHYDLKKQSNSIIPLKVKQYHNQEIRTYCISGHP